MEPDFHGFPPVELYHLPSDPDEKVNLADSEPEVVAFLIERMERWVAKRCAETGATDPILQYKMGLDRRIGSIGQARDLQAKSSTPAGINCWRAPQVAVRAVQRRSFRCMEGCRALTL
ncbi:MAG: hypothetical protein EBT22_10990 [Chloroflexi bacterium]|nr:hypothetical protein [Chloroflexota bacterium]